MLILMFICFATWSTPHADYFKEFYSHNNHDKAIPNGDVLQFGHFLVEFISSSCAWLPPQDSDRDQQLKQGSQFLVLWTAIPKRIYNSF